MATSREERMLERMRGAGRHEVADDSFAFVLPGDAASSSDPPSSVPPIRSEPNTSVKRRPLDDQGSAISQPDSTIATRYATRNTASHLHSTPTAGFMSAQLVNLNIEDQPTPDAMVEDDTEGPSPDAMDIEESHVEEDVVMQSDPAPRATPRGPAGIDRSDDIMVDAIEEVMESPVAAPGSGRRRIVGDIHATQSAKLQKVVMEEEAGVGGEVTTSSPLARKTRPNRILSSTSPVVTRASAKRMSSSPTAVLLESSPLTRHSRRSNSTAATGSARSTRSQARMSNLSTVTYEVDEISSLPDAAGTSSPTKPQQNPTKLKARPSPYDIGEDEAEEQDQPGGAELEAIEEASEVEETNNAENEEEYGEEEEEEPEQEVEQPVEPDSEHAKEIDDIEAARHIGRKRRRVSPRQKELPDEAASPASSSVASPVASPDAHVERQAKQPRRRQQISPAKQTQPKPVKEKTKKKQKKDGPPSRRKSDGDSIPVTVQRYTKPLRHNEGDNDEDILNADIPFTDHKSPNVIDVVLQMCEESIERYLSKLHEEATKADGAANRKMFRTKLRVVEAFQEELRTRLQGQAIALDNLRTLKKRVRAAQKEKLLLRNEILRIRAEREQVALKIDAVRNRHETANKETMHQLELSSAMDDIELAIENGKAALELTAKEERRAEVANLDLLISQISNLVSATGDGGGVLNQIKDFNMFLERAAAVLEGR